MDVGGTLFDRIGKYQVDQLNNRSVFTGFLQLAGVNFVIIIDDLQVNIVEITHDIIERGALIIIFVDRSFDACFSGHDNFNVVTSHEFDIVNGKDIGWICHGNNQRRASTVNRHQLVLLHNLRRDQLNDAFVNLKFAEINGRYTVLARQESREVFFFQIAEFNQAGT